MLSNLDNSYQYPNDIIEEINKYINEIMYLKENGLFTSEEDINNAHDSFNKRIIEAEKVAKVLDNVDIIDKVFDEIMIRFQEGFIQNVKYMDQIKSGNFTLEEDVLNNSLFTGNEKIKMDNELKQLRVYTQKYMNAGILLMNLKGMREDGIEQKIRKYIFVNIMKHFVKIIQIYNLKVIKYIIIEKLEKFLVYRVNLQDKKLKEFFYIFL